MKQITLGRSGIKTVQNAFGALPIQRISKEQAALLLQKAYRAGITFFDTARAYSDSEEKIGYALHDVRAEITIATKTMATDADGFFADLEKSLCMLRTDYIDLYQFHNPAACPMPGDKSGLYEAMCRAKEQGMIRHIGITNHRLHVARQAVQSGLYETLQFPFCYLASDAEKELVQLCAREDVGFIAMKGLSGGLLTHADAAMAFMLQYPNVVPIWGVQRERELDEFLSFLGEEPHMTPQRAALIAADREGLQGNFCRGCGYCMPCPAGIEINNCARMIQMIRRSPSAQWLTKEYQEKMHRIRDCVGCGNCRRHCPYGLDTPALLRENLEDYEKILSGEIKV